MTDVKRAPFFYGYTIIVAGFFIQTVVWGISNSFGIFFDPLIKEFGWSRATISGAASLGFLVHGASSILLGNFNDRFGPRLIMSACGLFLGLGFLLMGTLNSVWQLYLFYGLIASIGLGGIDVIPLSTVSRWFQKKRGMMSGIIKVGTGVG
ncbi:MAG: MFS transporter, partial [Desulfobacula sp.]|nr:MFS transporter [Desulfobacula sp.]